MTVEEDNTENTAVLGGPVQLGAVEFNTDGVAQLFDETGSMRGAGSSTGFTVTASQVVSSRFVPGRIGAPGDETRESGGGTQQLTECPKCGAGGVETFTQILQTRAADESGTEVTRTTCGCTLRRTD